MMYIVLIALLFSGCAAPVYICKRTYDCPVPERCKNFKDKGYIGCSFSCSSEEMYKCKPLGG